MNLSKSVVKQDDKIPRASLLPYVPQNHCGIPESSAGLYRLIYIVPHFGRTPTFILIHCTGVKRVQRFPIPLIIES